MSSFNGFSIQNSRQTPHHFSFYLNLKQGCENPLTQARHVDTTEINEQTVVLRMCQRIVALLIKGQLLPKEIGHKAPMVRPSAQRSQARSKWAQVYTDTISFLFRSRPQSNSHALPPATPTSISPRPAIAALCF